MKKFVIEKVVLTPTEKEIEIVQMLANDLKRSEIANKFNTYAAVIGSKLAILKAKCNVKTDVGLVVLFYKNHLIE